MNIYGTRATFITFWIHQDTESAILFPPRKNMSNEKGKIV